MVDDDDDDDDDDVDDDIYIYQRREKVDKDHCVAWWWSYTHNMGMRNEVIEREYKDFITILHPLDYFYFFCLLRGKEA